MQLLIVPDGQLKVPWNDTLLLVITSSIASQLKDLSSQVLQDGSEVNCTRNQVSQRSSMDIQLSHTWSASTNTLSVVSLLQQTMDTTNRELEAGLRGSGDGFSISTSLTASGGLSGFSCARNSVRHE